MQDFALRSATKSDCRAIASLYRISSDGVADYIWSTLAAPDENILDVGQRRYEREDSVFGYKNCMVVEKEHQVIGMLVAFPMIVEKNSNDSRMDPVLAPYSKLECDNSYYICGMAVLDEHRGNGIGTPLLKPVEQHANEEGLNKLSLIVFEQNIGAKRLYERHGYREHAREHVVIHPLIHYSGDALLMVKNTGH